MKRKNYRVVHKYGFGKYINGIWTAYVPVKRKKDWVDKLLDSGLTGHAPKRKKVRKKPRKEVCVCGHDSSVHYSAFISQPRNCNVEGCECWQYRRPKRRKK